MISEYVREQKRYTQAELSNILHCSDKTAIPIIRKLKQFGVLRSVKATEDQKNLSDLVDDDIEVADVEPDDKIRLYVFTFVGVIVVGGRVLKCYPKYISSNKQPLNEMKQVLQVISKYNRSAEQIVNLFNGDAEAKSFNLLAVILFLLNDYYSYGIYSNTEDIVEMNGEGDILWGRTIDENFPVISNGRPYYMEFFTRHTINDETDYFHRLHQAVITDCSKQLVDAQLTELFDIEPVELTDDETADFGDRDYILDRIRGELSVQFNTRKQILLKTMYAYISSERKVHELDSGISMFGTNSFNLVWEKVCAVVFNNMLQTQLNNLPLPSPLGEYWRSLSGRKLIDIIEKPEWKAKTDNGKEFSHIAADTLIPDMITIYKDQFIIFDAKYYKLHMEEDLLNGNPGIDSITKQYLYQLAYQSFVRKHQFLCVKNCFLFPTEQEKIIDKGYVELKMLRDMGLENISVRLIPARRVFNAYLSGRKIDISELKL